MVHFPPESVVHFPQNIQFQFYLPSLEEMRGSQEGLDMIQVIDDDNFSTALTTGCPGSGKTTVAVYRLARLINQKANVRFVTYQNMLVLAIKNLIKGQGFGDDRVTTFNKWYYRQTGIFFDTNNPPTSQEIVVQFENINNNDLEEILIDEGQDLPHCVFEAIPKYARRCFVGADNGQKVHKYGTRQELIEESFQKNFPAYKRFVLHRNFRNTYETYRFARQFMPTANLVAWDTTILDELERKNRRGLKPTVITYNDKKARDEHLETTLNNAGGNVAILCPLAVPHPLGEASVDQVYKLITEMGIQATKYKNGDPIPQNIERYVVTTFISSKGMEFDTVIIPRINFRKNISEEWYVACTRAKSEIFIYRDIMNPQIDPMANFDPDTYNLVALEKNKDLSANTSAF